MLSVEVLMNDTGQNPYRIIVKTLNKLHLVTTFSLCLTWLQNRIFQLESTCNYHLLKLPDSFRAEQKLKQVIKDIIQMPLER